jgi:phosphate transport system permease protein
VREAWTFISQVEWASLWTTGWFPRRGLYDVKTLLVGSLLVTAIAMVVAVPVGLGAAVYLAEYASTRVRRVLKPALEILAGIPSVVLGFFALTWISPQIVQRVSDDASLFNLAAAGIGVGILTVPLVASISEDAMRSVPDSLREASAGMGARKITTTVTIVVPAAVSGLVAAFIVAVSRAIGETMVVAIAAGATGGSQFTLDVLKPGQTMTAAMAAQAAGTDAVRGAALTFQSLFFVGLLLFLITLGLNLVADRYVRRVRQKY